jgi:Concanavalin A-like lectin/glucanases superfamily
MGARRFLPLLAVLACLATAPPAAGATLAGEWPLDEGGGQVAHDASGSGVDGRLGIADGADGADPAWVPGIAGWGLRFDGGDTLVLRDSAALEPANVTIEAWVRRQGTPGAYAYVVSKGAVGCEFSSYGLYTGVGRGMAFYVSDGRGYVVSPAAAPAQVWDGAWHHVAGTFDGHTVRLYVDGAEIGAGSPDHLAIEYGLESQAPYIGAYGGSCGLGFTGDIDDVRVWSSALTAAEISASQPTLPAVTPDGLGVNPLPIPPVAGPPPAAPSRCAVSINRKSLRAVRRNPLVVVVRRNGRPLSRVRVLLSGSRLRLVRRADGRGRAHFVVRPRRSERRVRIRALGRASSCSAASIPVRR